MELDHRLVKLALIVLMVGIQRNACIARWWTYSRILSEDEDSFENTDNRKCFFYNLNNQQLQTCLQERRLLLYVGEGANAGIAACQRQFVYSRWNCSSDVPKLYKKRTPESAYLHGIASVGAIYKIAYECDRGKLKNCGCEFDDHLQGVTNKEQSGFYWSYCKDHLKFGIDVTRIFLDPSNEETFIDGAKRSIKQLIVLQNNRAARKILRSLSKKYKKCRCYGPTGKCVSRICYRWLPGIKVFAEKLYKQYQRVLHVGLKDGRELVSKDKRPLGKTDLVYTERLNYCDEIDHLGIHGTAGRVCSNHEPRATDDLRSCQIFCCDRGYRQSLLPRKKRCKCRFIWCCRVECEVCEEEVMTFRCR